MKKPVKFQHPAYFFAKWEVEAQPHMHTQTRVRAHKSRSVRLRRVTDRFKLPRVTMAALRHDALGGGPRFTVRRRKFFTANV